MGFQFLCAAGNSFEGSDVDHGQFRLFSWRTPFLIHRSPKQGPDHLHCSCDSKPMFPAIREAHSCSVAPDRPGALVQEHAGW